MCTVILAHRIFDDAPILFGANRDEQLERPAEPPALRERGELRVLAPRDLKAGGTWLGLNEKGVIAAITNRFGEPADPSRRSRGELVDRALEEPSARRAADAIAEHSAGDYNGFHLLCADRNEAHLVWSDGESMNRSKLDPGLHVLTERSLGAAANARQERVLAECSESLAAGNLDEAAIQSTLSRCDDGSIDATCVSLPSLGYGTRSSTILRLGEATKLLHADGPPCSTGYEDLSALLEILLSRA
jgi:uncharacterized protein with NRDE domain